MAAQEVQYLHPDHLGSIGQITSQTGAWVQDVYFYPYGGIRWSRDGGTTPSPASATRRTYTGQYDIGYWAGAIQHYNARQYDYVLGRFLQPDGIVPNPGDPQTLNRFSYTYGNPLKYTDPSGHYACVGNQPGMSEATCTDWVENLLNSLAGSGSEGAALAKLFREMDAAKMASEALLPGSDAPGWKAMGYRFIFDSALLGASTGAAHPFIEGVVLHNADFYTQRGSRDWYALVSTVGHEFQHLLNQGPVEVLSIQAEAEAYQYQTRLDRDLSDTYGAGLYDRRNPSSFQRAALNVDLSDDASLRDFRDNHLGTDNPVYRNDPIRPSISELARNWMNYIRPHADKGP